MVKKWLVGGLALAAVCMPSAEAFSVWSCLFETSLYFTSFIVVAQGNWLRGSTWGWIFALLTLLETIVLLHVKLKIQLENVFWRCTSVMQRVELFQQIAMTFAIILMSTAPSIHHHVFKISQLLLTLTLKKLQVVFTHSRSTEVFLLTSWVLALCFSFLSFQIPFLHILPHLPYAL